MEIDLLIGGRGVIRENYRHPAPLGQTKQPLVPVRVRIAPPFAEAGLNFDTTVKRMMISRRGSKKKALPEFGVIGLEHRGHVMPAKRRKRGCGSCFNQIFKWTLPGQSFPMLYRVPKSFQT